MLVGVHISSMGVVRVLRTQMGAFTSSGVTAAIAGTVVGINVSNATSFLQLDSNTIGNTTTDNMRGGTVTLTTGSSLASGITLNTLPGNGFITRNTIQQLTAYGTNTNGAARGILTATAGSTSSVLTISNNTIRQLTTNSPNTSVANGLAGVVGINVGTGLNSTVTGNSISQLVNTSTATTAIHVIGIALSNAINTTVSQNRIFDLANSCTSTSATAPGVVAGIFVRSGTTAVTLTNNMIALGAGKTTNTAFIGIQANLAATPDPTTRVYHNTVHISGTVAAGAQPSFAFARTDFSATARTAPVLAILSIESIACLIA
jgi:hypothetical protein